MLLWWNYKSRRVKEINNIKRDSHTCVWLISTLLPITLLACVLFSFWKREHIDLERTEITLVDIRLGFKDLRNFTHSKVKGLIKTYDIPVLEPQPTRLKWYLQKPIRLLVFSNHLKFHLNYHRKLLNWVWLIEEINNSSWEFIMKVVTFHTKFSYGVRNLHGILLIFLHSTTLSTYRCHWDNRMWERRK